MRVNTGMAGLAWTDASTVAVVTAVLVTLVYLAVHLISRRSSHTEPIPAAPRMLWLDDVRPAPAGWTWCRSADEAITLLATGEVTHASLDHDLGDYARDGDDGIKVTDWMAEHNAWPTGGVRVHSSSPERLTMLRTVDRYSSYPPGSGWHRGTEPPGGWAAIPPVHGPRV